MTEAVLYSTSTYPWYVRARRYLKNKGVTVGKVGVERNHEVEMVGRTGQTGVPVIRIGPRWIVGFDASGIDRALMDPNGVVEEGEWYGEDS